MNNRGGICPYCGGNQFHSNACKYGSPVTNASSYEHQKYGPMFDKPLPHLQSFTLPAQPHLAPSKPLAKPPLARPSKPLAKPLAKPYLAKPLILNNGSIFQTPVKPSPQALGFPAKLYHPKPFTLKK